MEREVKTVFEVSWEVCNKVGGIFTVVSSKAATMHMRYGSGYYLVGPFFPKKLQGIFEEKIPPDHLKDVFSQLEGEGIHCVYGSWLVKGQPQVILVDFSRYTHRKNEFKGLLWDWFGIDTLGTDYYDFDEPLIWSFATARLLEVLAERMDGVVVHAHEWLAASVLLYLKQKRARAGLVFTTHATTLGRTLANSDKPLYELLGTFNPDDEARSLGASVFAKHMTEKTAAQHADVFSTVSEITGLEAEKLLGVKPSVFLYNGLDMEKFPTFEQITLAHQQMKRKFFDFFRFFFFPYYSFSLEHTRIFFLAGRNEIHDKGIDVTIDALGALNKKMIAEKSDKTVVTFFFVPGPAKEMLPDLVESKTYYNDIKETVANTLGDVQNRIINALLGHQELSESTLFDGGQRAALKQKVLKLKRSGSCPPVFTHRLSDGDNNPILQAFARAGLSNKKEDRVKVIFYPIYLTGADGLLDTNYYESMQAGHLGIFPSYYEPWGYTPQEAAALGVPSVTTDLAGFGIYMQEKMKEFSSSDQKGIFVLERRGKSYEAIVAQLTGILFDYAQLDQHDRVAQKIAAKTHVHDASWSVFGKRYFDAHQQALSKRE